MNVIAAGCVFPSGPGIGLASAALASRTSLVRRHPFHLDRSGTAARVSAFPEPKVFDIGRWIDLARAALEDLYRQLPDPLPPALQQASYVLYLVIPPAERLGVPDGLPKQLAEALGAGFFRFHSVYCATGGHADGVRVLQSAHRASGERNQCVVVLGVDCWLHPDALLWLENEQLLHGAGHMYQGSIRRNPYGRIPGEAAVAVMVHADVPGWCRIHGMGLADEPISRSDPRPCVGAGWSQAAQQAMSGLAETCKITHVFSDLNGEPYRADQFGFTSLRIADRLADRWNAIAPALVSGDVGSASSLLHIALSANLLRQQAPKDAPQMHLLLSSSDDHLRAAAVLAR